jgi:hypothetical protein
VTDNASPQERGTALDRVIRDGFFTALWGILAALAGMADGWFADVTAVGALVAAVATTLSALTNGLALWLRDRHLGRVGFREWLVHVSTDEPQSLVIARAGVAIVLVVGAYELYRLLT